jgi:hypothetical protein
LGAPAPVLCYLAKENNPVPHHNLCQQKANAATIRSLGTMPNAASRIRTSCAAAPCGAVPRIAPKDPEKYAPRDAGDLRAAFSLILGLVASGHFQFCLKHCNESSFCIVCRGTISMNDSKKPWYQLKDSESKWYHHLMHGRVLIMLVLMAIIGLLALGVGIFALFGE